MKWSWHACVQVALQRLDARKVVTLTNVITVTLDLLLIEKVLSAFPTAFATTELPLAKDVLSEVICPSAFNATQDSSSVKMVLNVKRNAMSVPLIVPVLLARLRKDASGLRPPPTPTYASTLN